MLDDNLPWALHRGQIPFHECRTDEGGEQGAAGGSLGNLNRPGYTGNWPKAPGFPEDLGNDGL
jgi:hypothetical protein